MKKMIILSSLMTLILCPVYSQEENHSTSIDIEEMQEDNCFTHSSFRYMNIGIGPLPFPALNLGMGARVRNGGSGGDFNCSLGTLGPFLNILQVSVNHLRYFKPDCLESGYMGFGAAVGGAISGFDTEGIVYCAPNFLFGREFLLSSGGRRFFQIETLFPVLSTQGGTLVPFVTIKYGIAF